MTNGKAKAKPAVNHCVSLTEYQKFYVKIQLIFM